MPRRKQPEPETPDPEPAGDEAVAAPACPPIEPQPLHSGAEHIIEAFNAARGQFEVAGGEIAVSIPAVRAALGGRRPSNLRARLASVLRLAGWSVASPFGARALLATPPPQPEPDPSNSPDA